MCYIFIITIVLVKIGTMSDNVGDWHIIELRDLLLTSTKQAYWALVLEATAAETSPPAEEWEDPREIREIKINRISARPERLALLDPSERVRWSVLGQLRDEIAALGESSKSSRILRHECVALLCARVFVCLLPNSSS
jgi:hypothetical protein